MPLPAQTINSGYYPHALLGEITYHHGGSISGFHRLSLGGNNDGTEHAITGNYQLNGSDGTYTIIDTVNGESVSYAFVLVDGDKEIAFMDISSKPNTESTVSATATGVQKRI